MGQQEEYKEVVAVEKAVKYYFLHENKETRYERSFEHFKTKLPGFSEAELRRILIRSGAVCFIREDDDKKEWWCHLDRLPEKYEKDRSKKK